MRCYICNYSIFRMRPGRVRDDSGAVILECANCCLVVLDGVQVSDIESYSNSEMHAGAVGYVEKWLRESEDDDDRRFRLLKSAMLNKKVLDVGCGAGGFLSRSKSVAEMVHGVEPDRAVRSYWGGDLQIYSQIEDVSSRYDLITAFHVLEHLQDPREMLVCINRLLAEDGCVVIEVPSSDDALLTLYKNSAFMMFTYWSKHLYVFNAHNLSALAVSAGFRVECIKHIQRYPLSNHLFWLVHGLPGGHKVWSCLDSSDLYCSYSSVLASIGKTDTIIIYLTKQKSVSCAKNY